MVEDEGVAVDFKTVGNGTSGGSVRQVPSGDVVLRFTDDGDIVKETWREVDPSLVCEESCGDVVITCVSESVGPPVDELGALTLHTDTEESEVIDTVSEAAVFVIEDGLRIGFRSGDVWGEEDGVFVEFLLEVIKSVEDDDIWVEVVDPFCVEFLGDVLKSGAFDGGAQFNDTVSEDPLR